jgi:hypothetical protein
MKNIDRASAVSVMPAAFAAGRSSSSTPPSSSCSARAHGGSVISAAPRGTHGAQGASCRKAADAMRREQHRANGQKRALGQMLSRAPSSPTGPVQPHNALQHSNHQAPTCASTSAIASLLPSHLSVCMFPIGQSQHSTGQRLVPIGHLWAPRIRKGADPTASPSASEKHLGISPLVRTVFAS